MVAQKLKKWLYFRQDFSLDSIAPICINDNFIQQADCSKLFDVFVSLDLMRDVHVTYLLNEVSKRFLSTVYIT